MPFAAEVKITHKPSSKTSFAMISKSPVSNSSPFEHSLLEQKKMILLKVNQMVYEKQMSESQKGSRGRYITTEEINSGQTTIIKSDLKNLQTQWKNFVEISNVKTRGPPLVVADDSIRDMTHPMSPGTAHL